MENTPSRQDAFREFVRNQKALRKRQRRFQIEILIAACFICLIAGFIAGASWHYIKMRGENTIIVVEPQREPVEPEKPRTRS